MRFRTWIIAVMASVALLGLGGTAMAQQGQQGGQQGQQGGQQGQHGRQGAQDGQGDGQNQARKQGGQGKMKQAAEHVMHAHRELFLDGKVVKIDSDRGSVVSTSENSIDLKFEDGSQARIDTVGQVRACIDGKTDAKITDLNSGDNVMVIRATNSPRGDMTLVVKKSNEGNLRSNCRPAKNDDQGQNAGGGN